MKESSCTLAVRPGQYLVVFSYISSMILSLVVLIGCLEGFFTRAMLWSAVAAVVIALALSAAAAFVICAALEVASAWRCRKLALKDFVLPGAAALVFLMIMVMYQFHQAIARGLEIIFWIVMLFVYVLTRISAWIREARS